MEHLKEHEHAFIKNGHISDILIFDASAHGSDLIEQIKQVKEADEAVCLCDYTSSGNEKPAVDWSWDGSIFTRPTPEYLYSIGRISILIAEDEGNNT